jgi:hypothetical protein
MVPQPKHVRLGLTCVVSFILVATVNAAESKRGSGQIQPQNQPRQSQSQPQQTQQPPTPNQAGTEQNPLFIKQIPPEGYEAERAEKAKADREKAELDRKLVKFNDDLANYTLLLAVVAILQFFALAVQTIVLARTLRATAVAARAAKESADSSVLVQRPYLYITGIDFRIEDEVGVTYRIENIGATPAILQQTSIQLRCLRTLPPVPDYSAPRTWRDRIVYNKEPIIDHGLRCIVPATERVFVGGGGYTAYFYGYFLFLDFFGKTRQIGFCYAFDGDMMFTRAGGNAYNYDREIT